MAQLVLPQDYSQAEWIDRGCLVFDLVLDDRKYTFSFYSPDRLIAEVNGNIRTSGAWSDSNVVALADLSLDSIKRVCEQIEQNGFMGFAPTVI